MQTAKALPHMRVLNCHKSRSKILHLQTKLFRPLWTHQCSTEEMRPNRVAMNTCIPHSCQYKTLTIPMTHTECIWIRITTGQASLVVGNIYRPPRSDPAEFVMELERVIKIVERPQDEIVLLSYFNAKNCLWHSNDSTDASGKDLLWLCQTHGLTQHLSVATHLCQHTPTSCLDQAISGFSHSNITRLSPLSCRTNLLCSALHTRLHNNACVHGLAELGRSTNPTTHSYCIQL